MKQDVISEEIAEYGPVFAREVCSWLEICWDKYPKDRGEVKKLIKKMFIDVHLRLNGSWPL